MLLEKAAYTYVIGADEWKKWDTFPVQQVKERGSYTPGEVVDICILQPTRRDFVIMFAVYVKKRTIYAISLFQKRIRVTIILTNKMMTARIFFVF